MDWQAAIDGYVQSLAVAGQSTETQAQRRGVLWHLARAMGGRPGSVTAEQLTEWCAAQVWGAEHRRGAQGLYRRFFAWCIEHGAADVSPALDLGRVRPAPICPAPTPEDVISEALAQAAPRVALMIRLGGTLGLRRGEISRIHVRDLTRDLVGWSLLVHGKGAKPRMVPMPEALARELMDWCLERQSEGGGGWAFPSTAPGRDHLTPAHVGKLISRTMHSRPHGLRHRAATAWHDADPDLPVIAGLLGHASVATTQRYVRPSPTKGRRLIDANRL